MKKQLLHVLITTIALCSSYATASTFTMTDFNFIAPSAPNRLLVTPQTGLIVYDNTDNGFFGLDASGSWVQLSIPASNAYVESKSARVNYSTKIASPDQYGDLTSITLTPGEWDISLTTDWFSNGATTTTMIFAGITTTAGNSTAGINHGENHLGTMMNNTNGFAQFITVPAYRVVITTNTTYYLKAFATGSITNLQVAYRLSARRIR